MKNAFGLDEETKARLADEVAKLTPDDEEEIVAAVPEATAAAEKRKADPKLLDGIKTMWRMLKDADDQMPWKTKAWILFGLAYFASPVDLIPDPIFGVGYVDDLAVVLWVLHQIQSDVEAYRQLRGLDTAS